MLLSHTVKYKLYHILDHAYVHFLKLKTYLRHKK